MIEATDARADAPFVVASLVGVIAVIGLVGSMASLVSGNFGDAGDRWVAAGGAALGAVALLATWRLLRRLQRTAREQLALPLEARLFIAELRDAVAGGAPLPERWKQRAVELYARLVSAGLTGLARELESSASEAPATPDARRTR
jgi:hypothetical protein